jgi:hypothetical protein
VAAQAGLVAPVAGFRPGFVPDRPYQSWATEYVYTWEPAAGAAFARGTVRGYLAAGGASEPAY